MFSPSVISSHLRLYRNPAKEKPREGERHLWPALLNIQLSIKHTMGASVRRVIDCRWRRFFSASPAKRWVFIDRCSHQARSCLDICMNICRRAPSLLRAKADNSAANKAESEREPIQTSVYRGKKNKKSQRGRTHLGNNCVRQ